jgi:DNA-binding transcriptional regulator YiaG
MTSQELLERARAFGRLPAPARRRSIRESAGISQREMAEALDVHAMTLNRWERGVVRPRGMKAAAYLRLLEQLDQAVRS